MAQLGAAYAFEQGETIVAVAWSNTAVNLSGTFRIEYNGTLDEIRFDLAAVPGTRVGTLLFPNYVAKDGGRVLGGIIIGGGLLVRGQCYVQVLIANADTTVSRQVLAAGYQYAGHVVTVGEIVEPGPAGGHGNIIGTTLAGPAAGADFADSNVPTGSIRRAVGFYAQFTAAVAAANRELVIQFVDGAIFGGAVASEVVTSGVTADFHGISGAVASGTSSSLGTGAIQLGLGTSYLTAGMAFRFKTYNINAADQYGTGKLELEEWVVPN